MTDLTPGHPGWHGSLEGEPVNDTPTPEQKKVRRCGLNTLQLARLEHACTVVAHGLGTPYLVGTAAVDEGEWRDVDVRVILADERFDYLFHHDPDSDDSFPGGLWGLLCLSVSQYLSDASGLPVDFQIQRMTEANEKYGGKMRNPMGHGFRKFAGGGDAT